MLDTGKQLIGILFNGWLLTFALLCLAAIAFLRERRRRIIVDKREQDTWDLYKAADARYMKINNERGNWENERAGWVEAFDAAIKERDSLINKRDILANEQRGWIKAFEVAIKERYEARKERDGLKEQLRSSLVMCSDLSQKCEYLEARRDDLTEQVKKEQGRYSAMEETVRASNGSLTSMIDVVKFYQSSAREFWEKLNILRHPVYRTSATNREKRKLEALKK